MVPSVRPPATGVVPSVPSLSMDSRHTFYTPSAATAKAAVIYCDGPPWPRMRLLSGMAVVVSPAENRKQGARKGRSFFTTSWASEAIKVP